MQKKDKQQKDIETEELIKSTARNLYFKDGKFGVTTQEIADAAGINRTLINYYFRSRDNLFNLKNSPRLASGCRKGKV